MELTELLKSKTKKKLNECSKEEIYHGICDLIHSLANEKKSDGDKRKLYYISAEFLIGRLLSNNLINLGIYDEIQEVLSDIGMSISEIEELEDEPSLGNGGLGRLAACFLDSVATLGLCGDGVGINYHMGLFKQCFENNQQVEYPNPWKNNLFPRKTDVSYRVDFKDFSVDAKMYDIDIVGYNNRTNTLHLFDIDTVDESIITKGIEFDKKNIKKNLTLFLYPDDSDRDGRLLRIYQQYFMVSAAAQLILDECISHGTPIDRLYEYAVIQINDTHPTMIIPELIRLMIENGMKADDAISTVSRTCAYTNHTILAEALEVWPLEYLNEVVPQLVPVIELLDSRLKKSFSNENLYIIDKQNQVHMAHIDIHYCFSVNGVASLHTKILKENELNIFHKIYPDKFNNKTNGISLRRWLLHANPMLSEFIASLIGSGFITDASELERLKDFSDNTDVLNRLIEIKQHNKHRLCEYLKVTQNISVDENTIFDIQIKRLHEYKRQQLNALYIINKYLEIKKGNIPKTPITFIFGAKAAPAYTIAQDIIHLILCLGELIEKDADVSPYLRVIMAENYNVTNAEHLIPACDISEQISLASKEASGTGNMKLMLNGAVTIGTLDGANVEIHKLVGDGNIYIFGDSSDTVVKRYKENSYVPRKYCEQNAELCRAVDFITDKKMLAIGNEKRLVRLKNELLNKDWFMTFPDFNDYKLTKERAFEDYTDRLSWARKMLVNISKAGYFSSDRTIKQYNDDIWHLIK